ncbi:MAG: hypothetical protein IH611_07475 [Deltaproteobacteria bacterium]|nr:hypothetical protein [Deltaproteobacteria bacterium]
MTVVERMQKLLEAERSRVICLEQLAFLSPKKDVNRMLSAIRNDASTACEMLHSLILQREDKPTDEISELAGAIMDLDSFEAQIAFLAEDEADVIRQIEEFPPEELTEAEKSYFEGLWHQHNRTIEKFKMLQGGGR